MLVHEAIGFAKMAGLGANWAKKTLDGVGKGPEKTAAPVWKSVLQGAGRAVSGLAKKPAVWKGGLMIGGGVATGAYLHKQLQKQDPMAPGALTRERRRVELDRYGAM